METDNEFYTSLQFHNKLGEGAFGTVHRVTFKKTYKGYNEAAAKNIRELRSEEVDIMRKLNHPHIVKFIALYSNGPVNIILLEYAPNGSLYDYLSDNNKPLSRSLQRKWAKQAALAIQYLHKCKCLHRDIKPSNCLLFKNNTLKLCDFGLAREFDHPYVLSSGKGTYQYMAPEIINTDDKNQAKYSVYTDLYAYGMLILAIYTRKIPFHGMNIGRVIYQVGSGKLKPDIPKHVPQDMKEMMQTCWEVDPSQRPTIDSILEGSTLNQWTLQQKIQLRIPLRARRLAIHPNGNMVVAVKHIHLLDGDGKCTKSLIPPEAIGPWSTYIRAVCISPQGHVYIVEKQSQFVRVFSESGTYLHSFSILTEGENPNKPVLPVGAVIDHDGNLMVVDTERDVITIHTCPGGEVTSHIKFKVKSRSTVKGTVNSKKHIMWHYTPLDSVYSRVVVRDYSGNELYSFTPKIDEDVDKAWVHPGGMVCDSQDNVFIALKVHAKRNTGHIHKYSPTGAFLECIAKGLYLPCDLSMTQDGSSIAVANVCSVLIYGLA